MLQRVLFVLKVSKKTNASSVMLKELNNQLKQLRKIIIKELTNKPLTADDCSFIKDFATQYAVENAGGKTIAIQSKEGKINESIKSVKLGALIYYYSPEDKKILVVGPIFNYQESR